jgi:hypothetical protein
VQSGYTYFVSLPPSVCARACVYVCVCVCFIHVCMQCGQPQILLGSIFFLDFVWIVENVFMLSPFSMFMNVYAYVCVYSYQELC